MAGVFGAWFLMSRGIGRRYAFDDTFFLLQVTDAFVLPL